MEPLPTHALHLSDTMIACSPMGDRLRVAGTLDLGRPSAGVDPRRIAAMIHGAAPYFTGWPTPHHVRQTWAGMRPMTADGLPLLDRLPRLGNAYVATGHGMFGVALAPASGHALAQYVHTGIQPAVLRPFSMRRAVAKV